MIKFSYCNRKNGELSNFRPSPLEYDGLTFPSAEAAYQAQKTLDKEDRKRFEEYDPKKAKKEGRKLVLRDDWDEVKYEIMVSVVYAKFTQNNELKEFLISTGDEELLEDTTRWHDNVWGSCNCEKCRDIPGQNLLGKALMEVRDRLKSC